MTPTVRHFCPGGRERGGGIGRLIGHIVDAAAADGGDHRITDTRGARWSPPGSLFRLAGAMLLLGWDRLAHPGRIQHVHVAGRGSTLRKLILTAFARAIGSGYVLHLHDYDYARDYNGRSPGTQARVRKMFTGASHVIVLGGRDRATVRDLLGVDDARISILPNCVTDPGAHPRAVRETPVIVFLGQLGERKGVPELLEALASPGMASLPWRAVLAGDGPVEAYRQRTRDLGLGARTDLPGWLGEAETRDLCAGADILVLPSHSEGLAMAVIEGLAHGLAVVTTRVGAHEEAIVHGETGIFVPVGDPVALAGALADLLRTPEVRARLAGQGRAHYLARFSMDAYMRRLQYLYAGLGGRRHHAVAAAE